MTNKIQFHVFLGGQQYIISGRRKLINLLGQFDNKKGELAISARGLPTIKMPVQVAVFASKEVLEGRTAVFSYLGESVELSTEDDVYALLWGANTHRLYLEGGVIKTSATTVATVFREIVE